ncbi:MAG: phosphatidylglycerophosphatase A [Phycisphaerae bacterium]
MTPADGAPEGRGTLARLIVTGLGTGYLPVAPGTWGSAAVCAIFLAAALAADGRQVCITGAMAVLVVAATAGCVILGRFAESAFGRKDPGECTVDEWAGQALALCMLPLGAGWRDWLAAAGVAFVAFRAFDIVKPPPAYQLQRLPHGWGIVADDLAAGVYANIAAQLVLRLALGMT